MSTSQHNVNRSEFIDLVANRLSVAPKDSEEILRVILQSMTSALLNKDRIEIRGFGVLSIKEYDGYEGRNPKTGERIKVGPKCLPVWRTGTELQQRIQVSS